MSQCCLQVRNAFTRDGAGCQSFIKKIFSTLQKYMQQIPHICYKHCDQQGNDDEEEGGNGNLGPVLSGEGREFQLWLLYITRKLQQLTLGHCQFLYLQRGGEAKPTAHGHLCP